MTEIKLKSDTIIYTMRISIVNLTVCLVLHQILAVVLIVRVKFPQLRGWHDAVHQQDLRTGL